MDRDKPSSKAREESYAAISKLFNFLDKIANIYPWRPYDDRGKDFKGWKG